MIRTIEPMSIADRANPVTPIPAAHFVMGSASESAANAPDSKPASVIPIWIVERKSLGACFMRSSSFVFLSPLAAASFSFVSLTPIIAISVDARTPFTAISRIVTRMATHGLPSSMINSSLLEF